MTDALSTVSGGPTWRSHSTVSLFGMFFMLSGYPKLINAPLHRRLIDELKALGVPAGGIKTMWVPTVEFTVGGAAAIGLLAPLAAPGPLVIMLCAIATSGRQRIKAYKPIDEADLPETLKP